MTVRSQLSERPPVSPWERFAEIDPYLYIFTDMEADRSEGVLAKRRTSGERGAPSARACTLFASYGWSGNR